MFPGLPYIKDVELKEQYLLFSRNNIILSLSYHTSEATAVYFGTELFSVRHICVTNGVITRLVFAGGIK